METFFFQILIHTNSLVRAIETIAHVTHKQGKRKEIKKLTVSSAQSGSTGMRLSIRPRF